MRTRAVQLDSGRSGANILIFDGIAQKIVNFGSVPVLSRINIPVPVAVTDRQG